MIKKTLGLIIVFTLMLSTFAFASEISIEIDDEKVEFTETSGAPFIDEQSRTQVPLRATMEAFGAEVNWDQENQTAIVEKDGVKVEVPIGKLYILKDGKEIATDTVAVVKNNRTYLPIRAVVEAFGAAVKWSNAYQTVLIRNDVKNADTGWFVAAYGLTITENYISLNTDEIFYNEQSDLILVMRFANGYNKTRKDFKNVSFTVLNTDFQPITEKLNFDVNFNNVELKPNEEITLKFIFPKSSVLDDNYDLTYNSVSNYFESSEVK
jgi:SLAP domain-containing protein